VRRLLLAIGALLMLAGCANGDEGDSANGESTSAQRQYVDWMRAFIWADSIEDQAVAAGTTVAKQIAANRSVPEVLESTTEARLAFERLDLRVRRQFPHPSDRRIARIDADYREGVRFLVRAYRILARGLKAAPGDAAVKALRSYVRDRKKGARLMIATEKQTGILYFRLGGPDRLGDDLPWSVVRARAKPPPPD